MVSLRHAASRWTSCGPKSGNGVSNTAPRNDAGSAARGRLLSEYQLFAREEEGSQSSGRRPDCYYQSLIAAVVDVAVDSQDKHDKSGTPDAVICRPDQANQETTGPRWTGQLQRRGALRGYQVEAVDILSATRPAAFLADDMGLANQRRPSGPSSNLV